jgi:hypothetical protein
MIDSRVLCIAGGGNAGGDTSGGGGGGGFQDKTVQLQEFTKYEVKVGKGGEKSGGNGGDSYIKKQNLNLIEVTDSFNAGYDEYTSLVVDTSPLLAGSGEIWAKINVSGTAEYRVDGVLVTLEGVQLSIVYDGEYNIDVTSLVSGKSEVTFTARGDDNTATIAIELTRNYVIKSIGGGRGGTGTFDGDGDGERGKYGGSGGGGGGAQSNESGGGGGGGVPNQGNAGGGGVANKSTYPTRDSGGGGGGGAGQAGVSASDGGANGGNGKDSDITGTLTYYAGGGYGGNHPNPTIALGQPNYGGGANDTGSTPDPANDGVVIFRYTKADVPHTFIGGTITDVGGDRIHTFTSDGVLEPYLPPTILPALM